MPAEMTDEAAEVGDFVWLLLMVDVSVSRLRRAMMVAYVERGLAQR